MYIDDINSEYKHSVNPKSIPLSAVDNQKSLWFRKGLHIDIGGRKTLFRPMIQFPGTKFRVYSIWTSVSELAKIAQIDKVIEASPENVTIVSSEAISRHLEVELCGKARIVQIVNLTTAPSSTSRKCDRFGWFF